jgi:hypothetical protein
MANRHEDNWLKSYLDYTAPLESPTTYHIWSGISIVAGCLRRRIWADVGFDVFPNLYIVLVGPAGKCRKTSAINTATKLITAIDGIYTHSSLTVISKELSVFLGTGNHDLLSLLTDMYDCAERWEYRTKGSGIDTIHNLWLNILGASTPAWLVGSMPLTAIGGGFTSRVIFVVEDDVRHKNPFPRLDKAHRKRLSDDLGDISKLTGEIKMTKAAEDMYGEWYESLSNQTITDPRFQGYVERKHIHLVKTAIVLSVCDAQANGIEDIHVKQALTFLTDIERNMVRAFGAAGRSPIAADIDTILNTIRASNIITKEQLIGAIAIDTLSKMGHIEIKFDSRNPTNPVYHAVKKK